MAAACCGSAGIRGGPHAVNSSANVRLTSTFRGLLPVLLFSAALLLNERLKIDVRLADLLYSWQGGHWRYRHDAFVAALLHDRGQRIAYMVYFATLFGALVCHGSSRLVQYRRGLRYVAASCTACLAAVALGKALLPIPCPWDLQRYGGHLATGGWLNWQLTDDIKGCFPAGHATAGYALFAWYFLARHHCWPYRHLLLLASLLSGLVLGLTQQVRGAHFASHDLATAVVCWTIAHRMAERLLLPGHAGLIAPDSP